MRSSARNCTFLCELHILRISPERYTPQPHESSVHITLPIEEAEIVRHVSLRVASASPLLRDEDYPIDPKPNRAYRRIAAEGLRSAGAAA